VWHFFDKWHNDAQCNGAHEGPDGKDYTIMALTPFFDDVPSLSLVDPRSVAHLRTMITDVVGVARVLTGLVSRVIDGEVVKRLPPRRSRCVRQFG